MLTVDFTASSPRRDASPAWSATCPTTSPAHPVPLPGARRRHRRHALHAAEEWWAHGRAAGQQGLRTAVGDAAAGLPRGTAVPRAAGAFTPPPKVDSAVVRLTPLPEGNGRTRRSGAHRARGATPSASAARPSPMPAAGVLTPAQITAGRGRSEGTGRTTRPAQFINWRAAASGLRSGRRPSPTPQKEAAGRCPAHRRRPHPKASAPGLLAGNPEADSPDRGGRAPSYPSLPAMAENRDPARALHPFIWVLARLLFCESWLHRPKQGAAAIRWDHRPHRR